MLLQRQYSLWKWINILMGILLMLFVLLSLFFQWRTNSAESNIKEKNVEIIQINLELDKLYSNEDYKKFNMAKFIKEKENNTNYYALYKYLNNIKNNIKNSLIIKGINQDRFQLAVEDQKVNISTVVPNYNYLYSSGSWLFDELEKKSFIEKIFVNSYQSKDWLIYFDINLDTK